MIDIMPLRKNIIQSLGGDFVWDKDGMIIVTEAGVKKLKKMGVRI